MRRAVGVCIGITFLVLVIGLSVNTSTPGAPVAGATQLYLTNYQPGDCLYEPVSNAPNVPWPDPVWQVPCTHRHVYEVFYANYDFWSMDAAYPGEQELAAQGTAECDNAFSAAFGTAITESPFTYTYVEPVTSADWTAGERNLECIGYEPDSGSPDGRKVITQSIMQSIGSTGT
jgi:hypothetical protein